ncbi:3-oxoadipyl-CoA thiolase [Microbulbifer magnicolonia]|uniref:3-oxoadipyl-CoA thiolase n=1 Tax=Microbulbifer magnicolonia TaxID=3109744 RepID=UPI002B40B5B7|nr:3-oxoadipyl-CoA thiolase [Microbulbifer sp. GG15]
MQQALICDAIRTPIGRYAGALASVRADELGAIPLRALIARNPDVDWEALDEVFYGCANQAGEDNRNVARMAALLAGLPVSAPGVTVNRLCGSGMEAVGQAARAIFCGAAQLAIAGGVESMSRAPLVMPKADSAFSRQAEIFDTTIGWRFINPEMQRLYGTESMPETAENVAERFNISREDQDLFALRSQQKCAIAQAEKLFDEELVPVAVARGRGEPVLVTRDEHPRADTSLASLAALRAPFRTGGSVTAGNASGVNDGACALLLASEDAALEYGLTARARVLGMASAGVEPRLMGVGPVPAVRKLLARLRLSLEQMDVIELNEAFAAQALAVVRQLGLRDDDPRVNPNGGAIALGHPLGMSGARLVTTAVAELHRRGGRYALCTMCVGVGQGIAMVVERL